MQFPPALDLAILSLKAKDKNDLTLKALKAMFRRLAEEGCQGGDGLSSLERLCRLKGNVVLWNALKKKAEHKFTDLPLHQLDGALEVLRNGHFDGRQSDNALCYAVTPDSKDWLERLKDLPVLAFDAIERFFFVHRRGAPALRFIRLLEFQRITAEIWVDQVYCYAIAKEEIQSGGKFAVQRSAPELAAMFERDLPPVDDALFDALSKDGLPETHRHFNGSMLPSLLWHRMVVEGRNHEEYVKSDSVCDVTGAALICGMPAGEFHAWMLAARDLRLALLDFLIRLLPMGKEAAVPELNKATGEPGYSQLGNWVEELCRRGCWLGEPDFGMGRGEIFLGNPWFSAQPEASSDSAVLLSGGQGDESIRERVFLTHCFMYLLDTPPSGEEFEVVRRVFSHAFHCYLLIQNLALRELVQPRKTARGFERFRLYSQSPVRRVGEVGSIRRIRQAARTGGVNPLELRLAPKDSPQEIHEQLSEILGSKRVPPYPGDVLLEARSRALQVTRDTQRDEYDDCGAGKAQPLCIGIVYHFIRDHDRPVEEYMSHSVCPARHAELRRKIWGQGHALANFRNKSELGKRIVGLDVANTETITPPEVFAPVIRRLRSVPASLDGAQLSYLPGVGGVPCNCNPLGLTYHAGEDFRHLLSGMRTVEEAVRFLNMGPGDRIGHGVALGLEPLTWVERYGGTFYLPKQEWLDNLVWFRYRLSRVANTAELALIVERDILELAHKIYHGDQDNQGSKDDRSPRDDPHWGVLYRSWQRRWRDPLRLDEGLFSMYAERKLDDAEERLFHLYHHDGGVRYRGQQMHQIAWARRDWESWAGAMRCVQDDLLRELKQCSIAIEANPTSNLTICPIDRLEDHPIFRWHPPEKDDDAIRPFVTLGTDDPGIFATELAYEYAFLSRAAQARGVGQREIRDWLRELRQTGMDFCFVRHEHR